MIEIVIDGNDNDVFLDKERPVFTITQPLEESLNSYRGIAKDFLKKFGDNSIAIVRNTLPSFSHNLFALAIFIESYDINLNMECAVFKVENAAETLQKYKPYVALTIAIKYALRLCAEDCKSIYKEISGLGYLGLITRHDYLNNKMFLSLPGKEPIHNFKANNVVETIAVVGTLKALSLLHTGAAFEAEINLASQNITIDKEAVIEKIMYLIKPWIN